VSIAAREGRLAGRELQPFAFGGEGSGSFGGLEDEGKMQAGRGGEGKGSKAWDQFAANEALFGVRAGFPEAAYTTTLNLAAFTPEQLARADALVASIAAGGAGADDDAGSEGSGADEEARFAAVRRPTAGAGAARADAFTDAGVAARIGAAAATCAPPAADAASGSGAAESVAAAKSAGAASVTSGAASVAANSARRGAAHLGGKAR
jgi:PAB1-binding protein PBP1